MTTIVSTPTGTPEHAAAPESAAPTERRLHIATALRLARTPEGRSLAALSRETSLLVVFVRHLGCTFCREALGDLAVQRAEIETSGARLAIVHMGRDEQARELFARFGLGDVARVSDPDGSLYRAFGLGRGRPRAFLGPRVLWRALGALFFGRHGLGRPVGDPLRMPGTFLVHDGAIVRAYRHETVADRPAYAAIARDGAREIADGWDLVGAPSTAAGRPQEARP